MLELFTKGGCLETLDDIDYLEQKLYAAADYRICKGIYLEPEEIAHTGYSEIVSATNKMDKDVGCRCLLCRCIP